VSVSEWGGDSETRVPGADVDATAPAASDPEQSANESGNDGSGDLRAEEEWQPGDPVYVEKPRRQHCLNAGCGTTWVGADVAECPECGGLVGAAAVGEPLCALDESNDMEAFAALPECVLCGGTGKQIPDGFWGVEAVDDTTVERVARAIWPGPPHWDDAVVQSLYGEAYRATARAAVRALRNGGGDE
jgi:hypothetical protein